MDKIVRDSKGDDSGSAPDTKQSKKRKGGKRGNFNPNEAEKKVWIIATDSEYVVKGMTEWLPTWKVSKR